MTLPSTPPLSFSQIKTEFSGSNNFSDYLAGGPYVPSGTTGVNGPVPSSAPLHFSDFLGTSDSLQQLTMGVGTNGFLFGFRDSDFGSLSTTVFFAGGNINSFWWNNSNNDIGLYLPNNDPGQSCFTNVNINGTNFSSASATYSNPVGGDALWQWTAGNPFGTSGTITIIFT